MIKENFRLIVLQSLIVWAISDGRECARGVDEWLMGETELPAKDGPELPRV